MNPKVMLVSRILLGIMFTVFGLNKIYPFLGAPEMEGAAAAFMGGLAASGYFFPFLGIVEAVIGIMLLTGKYTRLAAIALLPITINIVIFHLALAPAGIPGYLTFILNVVLIMGYKEDLQGLLK